MIHSGGDPDVSAKAAGHSKETKARYYKKVRSRLVGIIRRLWRGGEIFSCSKPFLNDDQFIPLGNEI
jgi:hypothetical protein